MPAYQVTDKAGHWVAGRRVSPGDVLQLTARQAEHELRLGTLVPVSAPQAAKAAPATTPKGKAGTLAQAPAGAKQGAS